MDSRTLAVVAGLIASPAVALADGLPPPPPPPVAATYCCEQAPPVWSGFYIGSGGLVAAWTAARVRTFAKKKAPRWDETPLEYVR